MLTFSEKTVVTEHIHVEDVRGVSQDMTDAFHEVNVAKPKKAKKLVWSVRVDWVDFDASALRAMADHLDDLNS